MQTDIKWKKEGLLEGELMQVREKGGVVYLTYPSLERLDMVRHGFSTRLGGVSQGIYASMNLSFSRGDERGAVLENYRRIADAIGFDLECIVTSDQTHTANVRVVTEADKGCGLTRARPYQDVDGMITNVPGLMLATFYADCVPLYLVDPVKKAVGLSHSGWKGTVGKIGLATVQAMEREYGTDPKDLVVAVGPSICQECYEVSEDVIGEFERAFSGDLWDKLFYRKPDGKYQLDLWEANRQVFMEAGVDAAKITLPGICTCCNPQFLFSHRASKGKRGNLGAFLGLV